MSLKYLPRAAAIQYLREQRGIQIADHGLRDLASKGRGPRQVLINGRACTTQAWLDEWIEQEAARPRRRRREATEASAAP